MKQTILSTLAFVAVSFLVASAAQASTLSCKRVAGKGPFASFTFSQNGSSVSLDNVRWAPASGAIEDYALTRVVAEHGVDGRDLNLFTFETVIDWGAGSVNFSQDDDGTHAFVSFSSDSGALSGYYSSR